MRSLESIDPKNPSLILYLSEPGKIRASNTEIISQAEKSGYKIIVITMNFPSSVLEKLYMQKGINTENIYYIDAISASSLGKSLEEDERHLNVKNPMDLTSLSIAITKAIKQTEKNKIFILFDSISSMLIYIPTLKTVKFIHFLTNKIRQVNYSGAFLAIEGGLDPMILAQVSSFVDEVVTGD
jgi:KaiC/GvpD/RAD55 family RecA-like ATPase